jgi:hypothetical protein
MAEHIALKCSVWRTIQILSALSLPLLSEACSKSKDQGKEIGSVDMTPVEVSAADANAATETPPEQPVPLDEAVEAVAEEYVAANLPMTDARRHDAQEGQIFPCDLQYPDTSTQVEGEVHRASPEIDRETRAAVESAYIKQNLLAAGVPESPALDLSKSYRHDLATFAALPDTERQRLTDNGQSPGSELVRKANSLQIPGAPQFKDPSPPKVPGQLQQGLQCFRSVNLKMVTPYRFVMSPASGRMHVIPQFSFRLCKARKIDAYSRDQCDNWTYVGPSQKAWLAGRYVYSAEWPDGRSARDVMNFAVDGSQVHDIPMSP